MRSSTAPAPSHRSAKPPTSSSRQPNPLPLLLLHKPRTKPSSRGDLYIRTDYDYAHGAHPCSDADLIFHMSPICTQQQSPAAPDESLQPPLLYSFPRPSHAKPAQKRTTANDVSKSPRPHPPISRPPPPADDARPPPPRRLEGFHPDAPPRSRAFQLTPPRTHPLSASASASSTPAPSPGSAVRTKHSAAASAQHVRFRDSSSPPYGPPPGLSAVPNERTPSWAASGLRNPFYGSEDDSEADEYYAYFSSDNDSGSSSSSSYLSTSGGGFLPAKTDPFRFSKFLADVPR